MANEKRLISVEDCPCDGCQAKPCGHPAKCVKFADWLNKNVDAIVPPVKIGQVLWCNIPHSEFPFECRVYCICREERNGLELDYFRCAVKGWFGKAFSFEDVGKTVFLTEAEALAKMDGERRDNHEG